MPSGDTLYNNALNDILTRKYDLAQQECEDYLKYYPNGAYASNAVLLFGRTWPAFKSTTTKRLIITRRW